MKTREMWGSRLGFILAVAGSAVGLANIWRFPFIVGKFGGSAFIIVYLLCLALIGFPVFISEVLLGRTTQTSPKGAFQKSGGKRIWGYAGLMTIATGFIVSSFYSAIAGWILGYLVEAIRGNLTGFESIEAVSNHHVLLMSNPWWGLGFHLCFMFLSALVLYFGIRHGIERGSKVMMPLLFCVLIILVVKGLTMPHAGKALAFLLKPDWSALSPMMLIVALGQAFFTLSLGQGTIVTYGSYLKPNENLILSGFPILLVDTLVSIFSAIAVFTIAFSVGINPDAGPGLLFQTLPWVFSQLTGGYLLAVLFFLLVLLAAITSQISAMEPTISYLIDEWKWNRHLAVFGCALGVFFLGIPCALSSNVLSHISLFGLSFLDFFVMLCSSLLIPLGGFLAVVLVGWVWGFDRAFVKLKEGAHSTFEKHGWLKGYFWFCLKYSAPFLMLIVFLSAMGVFS